MKKILCLSTAWFLALSFVAESSRAQGPAGLPELRTVAIAPGQWLDLDSGVALPQRKIQHLEGDLRFERDGKGLFLEPTRGAMTATVGEDGPGEREYSKTRLRVPRTAKHMHAFVQTNHGVARIALSIVNPYGLASAMVEWSVVPPKDPLFLAAPTGMRSTWTKSGLHVTWQGEQARYMVEVATGDQKTKDVVGKPEIVLADLDREAVHRITVRGLHDGAISVPATVTQFGPRQPAARQVVEFADRWYDALGGFRLDNDQPASGDAHVICYLYGVSVPGGGVQKLGKGEDVFLKRALLPEAGYLPSYDRLDESDVLAVRLPDGRYGLVYLEATDGGDLRSGMRVHTVFLPDGRRGMLAAPDVTATSRPAPELEWGAVAGAELYRVTIAGRPVVRTKATSLKLEGLEKNAVHEVVVHALTKLGDESSPTTVRVHTYPFEVRIGTVTLQMQRDKFNFAKGEFEREKGLALIGGAGSGQGLSFTASGPMVGLGARKFGGLLGIEIPADKEKRWYSDHRKPASEEFLVFPEGGGCAMVRIKVRGFPSVLEYLWMPELPKAK